jgi:flagellar hook-length control protein FliK
MQTTSLPIQLNTKAQAPAQRNGNQAGSDGAQFGAMLSNEMELRQSPPAPAPAPAPAAPKAETPKPQAADKPAQPDGANEAQQAAKPDDAGKPAASDKAGDAEDTGKADSEDGAAEERSAEAGDPANAMLALMASLQQPAQDSKTDAAGAAAQAFDALGGAGGKGKRGDAAQLAALQAAMKSVSRDGAGIATTAGKAFSETAALRNPALAAAGAGIVADDKPAALLDAGAKLGADLRANLAAGAGQAAAQPGSAELGAELALQQAREADIARSAAREPLAVSALAQAQPAVMETVQAAAAAAEGLSARVGSEAWEKQVGQKVVYMVGSEEQTASLTLNPPDLGPLQVVLSVTNDQASVTFSANQEEVRQALENALPRLREMMSESGIALGNATVNAGMPDGRQAQQQPARSGNGFGRGRGENVNAVDESVSRPVTRTAILGDRGMVDTFA